MAVEQPELHLHPALQEGLGDLFTAAIRPTARRKTGRRFLIETHSESLIARFSQLIVGGALSADDVIMYFVEKDDFTQNSTVRVGGFDHDGNVTNWPVGFFSGSI
jgi:predicted ATPase